MLRCTADFRSWTTCPFKPATMYLRGANKMRLIREISPQGRDSSNFQAMLCQRFTRQRGWTTDRLHCSRAPGITPQSAGCSPRQDCNWTIVRATSGTQPPKQAELQASHFNRHGAIPAHHDSCTWGAPRPHEQTAPKLPCFLIQQAERGRMQELKAEGNPYVRKRLVRKLVHKPRFLLSIRCWVNCGYP